MSATHEGTQRRTRHPPDVMVSNHRLIIAIPPLLVATMYGAFQYLTAWLELRRVHGPNLALPSRPSEKKERCPFSSATALTGQVHQRARPPLSP